MVEANHKQSQETFINMTGEINLPHDAAVLVSVLECVTHCCAARWIVHGVGARRATVAQVA
jgi:hypothetical protein